MSNIKDVFYLKDQGEGKCLWIRIGVAYINKDNSLNVLLDTMPLDGKLHIRDRRETNQTREKDNG